jgi:hypothetical protein
MPSSSKAIFPHQKAKNFFVYLPPTSGNGTGHFIHQPFGQATASAVACSVATPIISGHNGGRSTPPFSGHHHGPSSHHHGHASTPSNTLILPSHPHGTPNSHHPSTSLNGYAQASTSTHYVLQHPPSSSSQQHYYASSSGAHAVVMPVSRDMGQVQPPPSMPHANGYQQLVQANINGTTVYVPAGSQYVVAGHPVGNAQGGPHPSTGQPHQIVVHPSAHHGPQQHIYVQHAPSHNATSMHSVPIVNGLPNGLPPGTSYVTAQPNSAIHLSAQPHPSPHHPQQQPPQAHGTPSHSGHNNMHHHLPPSQHQQTMSGAPPHPQPHASTSQIGMPSHVAPPQMAHSIIDAGRTVVSNPKPAEPVFIAPPNSIQIKRVLHSETYLKYIESLYNGKQKTVSKWDKNLLANHRNTITSMSSQQSNRRKLPYDWIRHGTNGAKPKEDEIVRSLWRLRDHLLETNTGINRSSTITDTNQL